jgi:flagellar biosynthesis/type III secretory pathway protein FliH
MRRLLLIPALGVAALALTAPVQAQSRGWLNDGRAYAPSAEQSFYDSGRVAYDNGFEEGRKQGEKDGRKREQFRYQDEKSFQRADKGYHREYGSLDRYRQSFRTGYSAGYSEGYQRYAPAYGSTGGYGRAVPRGDVNGGYGYPNRYPTNRGTVYPSYPGTYGAGYYNPAIQNGINDGYEKGLDDARKNRSFDPLRHDWYRSGDRHYESQYGSREQYKDLYRQGFRDGYDRGFNEGRYR